MTLAVENANTKLLDVVAFADVDIDDRMVTADSLAIAFQIRQELDNSFSIFTHSFQYFFCQNLGLAFVDCFYLFAVCLSFNLKLEYKLDIFANLPLLTNFVNLHLITYIHTSIKKD